MLGPLCSGDSDIERLNDRRTIVKFDATCIRPYVRFFFVGHSQGRCGSMSRGAPEVDVDEIASAEFVVDGQVQNGDLADRAIGCRL